MSKDNVVTSDENFISRLGELDALLTQCWDASLGVELEFARLMDDLYRRVKKFADRHVLKESEVQSEQAD